MRNLESANIAGDRAAVEAVRTLFGCVEFATNGPMGSAENGTPVRLRVTHVLSNIYRGNGTAPLYILVPDKMIDKVWPRGGFDDVRYGTATDRGNAVTGAVCVHKGDVGLYFCLTPAGEQVSQTGALGI